MIVARRGRRRADRRLHRIKDVRRQRGVERLVVTDHSNDGGRVVVQRSEHRLVAVGPGRDEVLQRDAVEARRLGRPRGRRPRDRCSPCNRRQGDLAPLGSGGTPAMRSKMRLAWSRWAAVGAADASACAHSTNAHAAPAAEPAHDESRILPVSNDLLLISLMAPVHSHEPAVRMRGGLYPRFFEALFVSSTTRRCAQTGRGVKGIRVSLPPRSGSAVTAVSAVERLPLHPRVESPEGKPLSAASAA